MGQQGLAGKDRMHRPWEGPRGHLFPLGQGSLHPTPSGDENGAGFLKQSFLAWEGGPIPCPSKHPTLPHLSPLPLQGAELKLRGGGIFPVGAEVRSWGSEHQRLPGVITRLGSQWDGVGERQGTCLAQGWGLTQAP